MSRIRYLKLLEHHLDASRKVIDDLVRENYELRELLRSHLIEPQSDPMLNT